MRKVMQIIAMWNNHQMLKAYCLFFGTDSSQSIFLVSNLFQCVSIPR